MRFFSPRDFYLGLCTTVPGTTPDRFTHEAWRVVRNQLPLLNLKPRGSKETYLNECIEGRLFCLKSSLTCISQFNTGSDANCLPRGQGMLWWWDVTKELSPPEWQTFVRCNEVSVCRLTMPQEVETELHTFHRLLFRGKGSHAVSHT